MMSAGFANVGFTTPLGENAAGAGNPYQNSFWRPNSTAERPATAASNYHYVSDKAKFIPPAFNQESPVLPAMWMPLDNEPYFDRKLVTSY